jgi:transcriptional regulator with XRE-family HTH domain
MAPTPPPTVRQRRLGAELRRKRERAGLSSTAAAAQIGWQQARMSMIEAGRYAVSAERVRALAHFYGCTNENLIEALTHLTGRQTRGWWEEYREVLPSQTLDLAELEHHARTLRVASIIHVPGLLQTRDHARVVISDVVPALAQYEVEHWVSHRLRRQGVIAGTHPTPFTAIVHEAALRMGFGGPEVARAQLNYLLERSEEPHIRLLVIPFGTGSFPAAGHGIDQFGGEVGELDTVQLDTDHGSIYVDAEAQLIRYRKVLDRLEECTLKPRASRDLIRGIARAI